MKALTESLALFAPPLWLAAAFATLLGAALLMAFVDALHENVRRCEEMRQWQRVGAVRQHVGPVASTATHMQPQPSGAAMSPSLQ